MLTMGKQQPAKLAAKSESKSKGEKEKRAGIRWGDFFLSELWQER
jgi:hypothetical protein